MLKLRLPFLLVTLALGGSALADFDVQYDYSDSRTIFHDMSQAYYGFASWNGSATYYDPGGQDVYLNSIEVVPGSGFDSSIHYSSEAGGVGSVAGNYTLGTAIASGSNLSLGNVVDLDVSSGGSAAVGTYDLDVAFRGGADASATDLLKTWNLHIEVFDKLDVTATGSANDITAAEPTSHLRMTVQDNMTKSFVSTSWFEGGYSLPPDGMSYLTGNFDFTDTWFNKTIAPGDSLTGAHTNWTANATTVPGTYVGNNGVVGGLHNGDYYYVPMDPVSSHIVVHAVPEPAALATLGLGALGFLRRRRKA